MRFVYYYYTTHIIYGVSVFGKTNVTGQKQGNYNAVPTTIKVPGEIRSRSISFGLFFVFVRR